MKCFVVAFCNFWGLRLKYSIDKLTLLVVFVKSINQNILLEVYIQCFLLKNDLELLGFYKLSGV